MKSQAHKHKPQAHGDLPQQRDDDVWAWVVIGLIFGSVTLALYGPLVWLAAHGS